MNLDFADNIALLAETKSKLQEIIHLYKAIFMLTVLYASETWRYTA